jgi:hypothetical protein|nr:MAG TPA: hypothetical protein [Caudoviricetes sp.]
MSDGNAYSVTPEQLADVICTNILSDFAYFTMKVSGTAVDFYNYSKYRLCILWFELEARIPPSLSRSILDDIVSNFSGIFLTDYSCSAFRAEFMEVYTKFRLALSSRSRDSINEFVSSFRMEALHRKSSDYNIEELFACFTVVTSWLKFDGAHLDHFHI